MIDNQFGFRKNHSTTHTIITLVEKVSKALDTGKIVVGSKKAHYMILHRARLKPTINVFIRQDQISLTISTQFLRIIIDYKLKWTEHIAYVKNKIS